MNYGVIPSAIAEKAEKYRNCIDQYRMAGIAAERIIVVATVKEVLERLKRDDMLAILYQTCLCSHVDEVLSMAEQLLSQGITLCFLGRKISIITPEDLPILQVLMKQICRQDKKASL